MPTNSYYAGPLALFNDAAAPDISSLSSADRQRLADRMADGTWGASTMNEKTLIYSRHPVLAKALAYAHERSSVTPAGLLIEELVSETRDERQAREARESVENTRARLRELGYPGSLDEARQDKAALLALVSGNNLTAKMAFSKLPEHQQMAELAANYTAHLEKLRSQAQAALDKATNQLNDIARRGEEINALLSQQQPPTDPAPDSTEG